MKSFVWNSPSSLVEAAGAADATASDAVLAGPSGGGALVKAGGIDVIDLLKEGLIAPRELINLGNLPGLDDVSIETDGSVHIGARVTLASLAQHPEVRRRFTALADAAGGSASPQIRNVATIGGNLLQRPHCWYFRSADFHCLRKGGGHCFAIDGQNRNHAIFDNHVCAITHPSTAATALVALNASVTLIDEAGATRSLSLEKFFVSSSEDVHRETNLRPREILTEIAIPPQKAELRTAHVKASDRQAFDWPLADVAVAVSLDDDGSCRSVRVVLGSVAPTPMRARSAELALAGLRPEPELLAAAAVRATDGATPLSGNGYKISLVQSLVEQALTTAVR